MSNWIYFPLVMFSVLISWLPKLEDGLSLYDRDPSHNSVTIRISEPRDSDLRYYYRQLRQYSFICRSAIYGNIYKLPLQTQFFL